MEGEAKVRETSLGDQMSGVELGRVWPEWKSCQGLAYRERCLGEE